MNIVKSSAVDKIEIVNVLDFKVLQVRTAIQIIEDGNVISTQYERVCVNPDVDIKTLIDDVKLIAKQVFTDTVKQAYLASLEKKSAPLQVA